MSIVQSITETYTAEFTTDLFVKPAVEGAGLNNFFEIRTGIKNSQAMYFTNPLDEITERYVAANRRNETTTGISISEKLLTLGRMRVYVEQDNEIWKDTIFETKMRTGVEENEPLADGALQSLMQNIIVEAAGRDAYRAAWFDDADGGNNRRNKMNGFWKQILQNVPGYCVDKIQDIGASLPTGANVITLFRNMYQNCDLELAQVPDNEKHFLVTRSLYNSLLAALSDPSIFTEFTLDRLANGTPQLRFYGVDVVPMFLWDQTITQRSLSNPHRIVYTPKPSSRASNWILGLDNRSDETFLKAWYSDDDDEQKFEMRYKMGLIFKHCGMTAVAY